MKTKNPNKMSLPEFLEWQKQQAKPNPPKRQGKLAGAKRKWFLRNSVMSEFPDAIIAARQAGMTLRECSEGLHYVLTIHSRGVFLSFWPTTGKACRGKWEPIDISPWRGNGWTLIQFISKAEEIYDLAKAMKAKEPRKNRRRRSRLRQAEPAYREDHQQSVDEEYLSMFRN